jgi:predicted RNA-binding protein Jag
MEDSERNKIQSHFRHLLDEADKYTEHEKACRKIAQKWYYEAFLVGMKVAVTEENNEQRAETFLRLSEIARLAGKHRSALGAIARALEHSTAISDDLFFRINSQRQRLWHEMNTGIF